MMKSVSAIFGIASAIAVALLLAVTLAPAAAQELGPPVGAKVPDIGTLADQKGAPRSLSSLMGGNGLVLFFVRSADWCPYCQAQMIDLNGSLDAIERRGYKMASISYDSPQILSAFTERRGIRYTMLSDPGSKIIDLYKLRDPQYPPGSLAYGVPRPIIFVLDKSGTVKAKLYEESYRQRPPAAVVVSTLDKISARTN
jgi:peroxiredoxin